MDMKLVMEQKEALLAGNQEKISKQHASGKATARERISQLLDAGSFVETDTLLAANGDYAGVVTGYGTVDGRPVYLFSQDFTVHGGAMGVAQAQKINKILDLAVKTGAPVICVSDSAGVKVDEGAKAMNAFASIYARMAKMSGICPMINLVMGPVVGGAAMLSQLADVTVQAKKTSALMVYGPTVVGSLTGKTLNAEQVGGTDAMGKGGAISLAAENEEQAIALCKKVLSYLPGCNREFAELIDNDDLNRVITGDAENAEELLKDIADLGEYIELKKEYGKALHTVLCRIGGHSTGIVCCDCSVNEGMIDAESALKAARFIRFCDCYDLPVVSLINSKGVKVPDEDHQADTLRAVSALLYAYAEATTAKISVITGKAIGQSYVAMAGKDIADMTYAWPEAVISALTPEAAVQVLYANELKNGGNRFQLEAAFMAEKAGVINAASEGLVDDICEPAETRKYIITALEMLQTKEEITMDRKHGNMPM